MQTREACALARDLTGVPFTLLEGDTAIPAFCALHQFHPAQRYLLPQSLARLVRELSPDEVLATADIFRVRFLLFTLGEAPVAVGPFCSELFSLSDCETLLRQAQISDITADFLLVRRGSFPVVAQSELLHAAHALARATGQGNAQANLREVNFGGEKTGSAAKVEQQKLYAEVIMERYRLEGELMEHIRRGDANAAVAAWRGLHQAVAYKKQSGQTLAVARLSAGVTRTVIRLAAHEAGLPALVNDRLSGDSTAIVSAATTIDAINAEHGRLIRAYCQAIRERRDHHYSNLTLSAIYQMERHYAEPITVQGLAAELDIAPGKLTTCFHKETGKTPVAYLTAVRMRQAARLLAETADPVQQIAAAVGILDANYFTKLFKRHHNQTPLAYRRSHHL